MSGKGEVCKEVRNEVEGLKSGTRALGKIEKWKYYNKCW
jgi:hypothetical protein